MVEPDPLGAVQVAVSIRVFAGLQLILEITKQTSPLKQTCQIILLWSYVNSMGYFMSICATGITDKREYFVICSVVS